VQPVSFLLRADLEIVAKPKRGATRRGPSVLGMARPHRVVESSAWHCLESAERSECSGSGRSRPARLSNQRPVSLLFQENYEARLLPRKDASSASSAQNSLQKYSPVVDRHAST
jgi:hypothetical protein